MGKALGEHLRNNALERCETEGDLLEEGTIVPIESVIRMLRGEKVILDEDLAVLYGVDTKTLVRAVKRNSNASRTS
jgi:hypothetical protein